MAATRPLVALLASTAACTVLTLQGAAAVEPHPIPSPTAVAADFPVLPAALGSLGLIGAFGWLAARNTRGQQPDGSGTEEDARSSDEDS